MLSDFTDCHASIKHCLGFDGSDRRRLSPPFNCIVSPLCLGLRYSLPTSLPLLTILYYTILYLICQVYFRFFTPKIAYFFIDKNMGGMVG